MNLTSMRRRAAPRKNPYRIDAAEIATWLLGFVLVVYLGLEGGGYDPLIHDQVGIAVWWIALAGVVAGALPRQRPATLALVALALFGSFVAWTALSLAWTESTARTSADLARVAAYLGVFALAILASLSKDARRMVSAVAAGIVVVATVALLSRLEPSWFPDAMQTAVFIEDSRERLSYPLNYWNGLGALVAIGIPLGLQIAAAARSIFMRALAAASVPLLALTAFYTLSRGGIAAAILALAVYLALAPDRLPRFLSALAAGGGSALLIAAAAARDALQEGLRGPVAVEQGDEMLLIVLGVCFAVGAIQAGIAFVFDDDRRPDWTFATPRQAAIAAGAGAIVVLVAALALSAPGRVSSGWDEFREGGGPGTGAERLGSVAGQSRYELWGSAVEQNATKPLTGTGSGTFEFWWARNGTTEETVRDTHSLYLQTFGELGVVGLVVLVAFLLVVIVGGVRNALGARGAGERGWLAAALAGCTAFLLTATVDWMWQIPVLATAMLLLAATLVSAGLPEREGRAPLPMLPRTGFAALALASIIAIAIPLASTSLLRQSEAEARAGDLDAALERARSAQNVQPGAGPPRLQEALVLEQQGDLAPAAVAARAATRREPTNWRNWLVLSRIEAKRGHPVVAVRANSEAESLNPHFSLFRE